MGCDHVDALRHPEAGGVGVDDKTADALAAALVAGAGEHGVVIGDAAVGYPGLAAVQHVLIAVQAGAGLHGRHVGAGVRLGQGEGRNVLAAGHFRQILLLQGLAGEHRHGTTAQALHGEGEIRQAGIAPQGLPGDAQATHVQGLGVAAVGRGYGVAQETGLPQHADQLAALGVHVVVIVGQGRQVCLRPGFQLPGELPVPLVEKGPGQEILVAHGLAPQSSRRETRGFVC